MHATGFVIHHSVCGSINGKGYDFFVTREGIVIPAAEPTEPGGRLHICLEGDFSHRSGAEHKAAEEQLFVAAKLIARLAAASGVSANEVYPHGDECPGGRFPWAKLVLSLTDRYH